MAAIKKVETWDEYFAQTLTKCSGLNQSNIEELRERISLEIILLDLNELSEEEKLDSSIKIIDKLIASHLKSEATTKLIIEEASLHNSKGLAASTFPVSNIDELPEIDNPHQHLEELMVELRLHGDYERIREEYCQLAILLNLQGRLAPGFRPILVTGKRYGDHVFNAIHRDQLVIDCHWLQATKQFIKPRAKDVEFAQLFKAATSFPFNQAWEFANKKWSADHRAVDMLRLTEFQQCQLAALRSSKVKDRIKLITQGYRKDGRFFPSQLAVFEQGLNAWCERDRRIFKYRDGYEAVWKARLFLGERASVRQVGELAAMMLGETPKDEKTIRSKEEKIRRNILDN